MSLKSLSGTAVASVVLASMQIVPAWADGPKSAYGDGVMSASPDPGKERVTDGELDGTRQKDLSGAWRDGYVARAKEDAETYAASLEQRKHLSKPDLFYEVPPLPPGMPQDDAALKTPAPRRQAVERAAPVQPRYETAAQETPYAPLPTRYPAAPDYPPALVLDSGTLEDERAVYVQPGYAAPLLPPVQYVPVYAGEDALPDQVVALPVIAAPDSNAYPVYPSASPAGSFPRPYRNGPMIYQVSE